jgi:hypothetical protein
MHFNTTTSGSNTETERLTILNSGKIGINSSAPTVALEVRGSATDDSYVNAAAKFYPGIYNTGGVTIGSITGNTAYIASGSGSANGLRFFTAGSQGTPVLQLANSGNVGVGTTSPSQKLDVLADGSWATVQSKTFGTGFFGAYLATSARGTESAPSPVQLNDIVGHYGVAAYDGANYIAVGSMNVEIDGAVSANSVPSRIVFKTNSGASSTSEKMRIIHNGNVGIGTSTPASPLHVRGSDGTNTGLARFTNGNFEDGVSGSGLLIRAGANTGNTYSSISALSSGFTAYDNLVLNPGGGRVGLGTPSPSSILHVYDSNTSDTSPGTPLTLETNNSFATLLMKSAQSTKAFSLHYGMNAPSTGNDLRFGRSDKTTLVWEANPYILSMDAPANTIAAIASGNVGIGTGSPSYKLDVNGTIRGFGITDSSDLRLKQDVETLAFDLEKILQLRGVSYYWKDQDKNGGKKQIGLIAQEIEELYPELVDTDDQGMKSVNYSHLVAPLIESIKSIYRQILQVDERLTLQTREIASIQSADRAKDIEIHQLKKENKAMKEYLCLKDPQAAFCK